MESTHDTPLPSSAKKGTKGTGFTVGVDADAHRHVAAQAKKLKTSKSKYASAAIAFFAESGLDPTAERTQSLAMVGQKVDGGVANVRAHNADIGNRLFALTRGFEKTIYLFMQRQQLATYSYLEAIEGNLLRHLVSLETHMLAPIVEHLFKTEQEAYINRGLSQRILLDILKQPASLWDAQNDKLNGERDQVFIAKLRDYLQEHKMPVPRLNQKPGATPVPEKPVAPPAAVGQTTPKP